MAPSAMPGVFHFAHFSCKKVVEIISDLSKMTPTKQVSSVVTGQMSSVETGQMCAVGTGQMSAVEAGQMSAAETGQMSSVA